MGHNPNYLQQRNDRVNYYYPNGAEEQEEPALRENLRSGLKVI
jgi:hypothetical protein